MCIPYPGLNSTLPKTKIAPGNRPSQKENSMPTIHFAAVMLDLGRVCNMIRLLLIPLIWGGTVKGEQKGHKRQELSRMISCK